MLSALVCAGIGEHLQAADEATLDVSGAGQFWQQAPELVTFGRTVTLPTHRPAPIYTPLRQLLLDSMPTLPADLIDLVGEYTLQLHLPLFLTPQVGRRYWDSIPFCTIDGNGVALLQGGFAVRQIIGWGGRFANGVGLVLGPARVTISEDANLDGSRGFITYKSKFGRHNEPHQSNFILHADEFVVCVEFFAGEFGDSLRFRTSEGRIFRIGSSDGGQRIAMHAPPDTALVGLMGNVGGHMHSIGCAWASTTAHRQQTAEAAADEE